MRPDWLGIAILPDGNGDGPIRAGRFAGIFGGKFAGGRRNSGRARAIAKLEARGQVTRRSRFLPLRQAHGRDDNCCFEDEVRRRSAFEFGGDCVGAGGAVPLDMEDVRLAADLAIFDVGLAAAGGLVDCGVVPLAAACALET